MTERYDIGIIDGEIIGLATARALLERAAGVRLVLFAGATGATGSYEMYRSLSKGAFVRALQRLVPEM